ncbi:hypothetical protein O3P69_013107 [Scylla paramamosain]|uniref:Uncharacterized protein n=1 Tax=Scylla paramamosain TaxID=85552 RepID=A0AAW0TZA6_SCYPA
MDSSTDSDTYLEDEENQFLLSGPMMPLLAVASVAGMQPEADMGAVAVAAAVACDFMERDYRSIKGCERFQSKYILADKCLHLSPTKQDVFVCDPFEGKTFVHLTSGFKYMNGASGDVVPLGAAAAAVWNDQTNNCDMRLADFGHGQAFQSLEYASQAMFRMQAGYVYPSSP